MARLTSPPSFTGTVGAITVYRMFGQYYMRSRSTLTGKRVKKDPAFRKTMQYAAWLAHAARIASSVYGALPVNRKKHRLYRKLTGEAMTWLKYQWKEEDIIAYLVKQYGGRQLPVDGPATKLKPANRRARRGLRSVERGLVKKTPGEYISIELRAWRRRDQLFRQACREKGISIKSVYI
ncbi:hypothetical protein [Paraflavitalea speifideaquila]|uniref:hypothetical protein n=1 Tax=Paraflavitalea speifideaquila TaxID=3076558 RepID=UPI0028E26F92|nr:hypothetical protein [Paraflavitalea speifideiaquila]